MEAPGSLLVVAVVLAACSGVGAEPIPATLTPAPSSSPSVSPEAIVRPSPPASCPVTIPDPPFVPPEPYRPQAPDLYEAEWYGTADLWTMLDRAGEVWWALPRDRHGLGEKTFWWSQHFVLQDEPRPAISVAGRRLDAPSETFEVPGPGTNGGRGDIGTFMLVGVQVPRAGCWELTATYREKSLAYVAWVAPD